MVVSDPAARTVDMVLHDISVSKDEDSPSVADVLVNMSGRKRMAADQLMT